MSEEEIQKLQQEIERLRRLVYFDELTGLLNRRGFMEEAERQFQLVSFGVSNIERRTGHQIPFSIIFVDLDDFKKLNDAYGHSAGDAALREVSHTLKRVLRSGDLVGRLGGEEFVVALLGADPERGKIIGEKLRKAVEDVRITFEDRDIPVTASVGVASYRNHASLEALLHDADQAMYGAKQAGKNRVVVLQD